MSLMRDAAWAGVGIVPITMAMAVAAATSWRVRTISAFAIEMTWVIKASVSNQNFPGNPMQMVCQLLNH
jgi:hypothetical protein